MQSLELTKPLKARLESLAKERQKTVSALMREILEDYLENRQYTK